MITSGTRVEDTTTGLAGTVIGEPEQTPTGLVATVRFDDAFAAGTPSGKVDVRVSDLVVIRPVGEAHGQPLTYSQLMDVCDDLEAETATEAAEQ